MLSCISRRKLDVEKKITIVDIVPKKHVLHNLSLHLLHWLIPLKKYSEITRSKKKSEK